MNGMIPTLLAIAAVAPALETPLVIRPTGVANANFNVVLDISPSIGVMNLYSPVDVSSGTTRLAGAPFLNYLEYLDKYVQAERKGVPYSLLRIGSPNCKPTGEEFLAALPNKATAKEIEKKQPSLQERARDAENNYWSKDHEFDGVVRAAWNGQYVLLCIPSKHALLFYETTTDKMTPLAYMNYGPQLLVPVAYNSNPSPQQVFDTLPAKEKAKLEEATKKAEEATADTPTETPKSEAWVGAASANIFVLVDTANNMVMTYEFTGKTLAVKSVRNIKYDLMIPPGQNYKSVPNEADQYTSYVKQRKKELAECGLEPDLYSIHALVAANSHGKAEGAGLQANMFEDKVVLDFTQQHKLLVYGLSTNSLDLVSTRDYTLDLGITLMEQEIEKKVQGRAAMKQASDLFKSHDTAMRLLKFALKLDPYLVDAVEKDTRLSGELKKEADWEPMIDQAHKDKDKAEEAKKAMREAAKKAKEADDALGKAPAPR